MYLSVAQKANHILYKYNISSFPISVDIIDVIIEQEGLSVIYSKALKDAMILNNTIFINQQQSASSYREVILHEYGHYVMQYGNVEHSGFNVEGRFEGKAQAFSAYFLMPVGIFENLATRETIWEIMDDFGVNFDLVMFREKLSISLKQSGYYQKLIYIPKDKVRIC